MTLPLVIQWSLWCPEAALDSTICVLKSAALTLPPLGYLRTHKLSHGYIRTHPPVVGLWGRLACCVQVCGWLYESAPLLTCIPSSPTSLLPSSIHPSISLPPEQMPKGQALPEAQSLALNPWVRTCGHGPVCLFLWLT